MKRLVIAVICTFALVAAAQKAVTFTALETTVDGVDLRRAEDGGISVTVYATNKPSGSDVTLQRTRTCVVENLTTAQKAALHAVRTAALACWNSAEGL